MKEQDEKKLEEIEKPAETELSDEDMDNVAGGDPGRMLVILS